jgi:hypothetical protein
MIIYVQILQMIIVMQELVIKLNLGKFQKNLKIIKLMNMLTEILGKIIILLILNLIINVMLIKNKVIIR